MNEKENAPKTSAKVNGAGEAGTDKSASPSMVSQKKGKVNLLQSIRVLNDIPAAEIVENVRTIYPKFDKPLLSKCEHGDEYGICLKRDAMELLVGKYVAVRTVDNRRLKCRVSCRLTDEDYSTLRKVQKDNGFQTMQLLLTFIIRNYISGGES